MFAKKPRQKNYDRTRLRPVLRCSVCTGEQTAGFQDLRTGRFEEAMLIRSEKDLQTFLTLYGIEADGALPKIY